MKLFISYRRKTWAFAQNLLEKLSLYIQDDIFMDLHGVSESDFEKSILANLRSSQAVLLVISEFTFADRIHNDHDWVRKEIREALIHNIPIVLICENGLLPPHGLLDDIKDVARSQGINFYPEYFTNAVERLVEFLVRMGVATRRSKKIIDDALEQQADAKPITGRTSLTEGLDLLDKGELDKGIFVLEELLKNGYTSNIDYESILNRARSQRDILLRERTAQYDYDEILELVKRKFSEEIGLDEFRKWCQTYPDLIETLDVANIRQKIASPSDIPPPSPVRTTLLSSVLDVQKRTCRSTSVQATGISDGRGEALPHPVWADIFHDGQKYEYHIGMMYIKR